MVDEVVAALAGVTSTAPAAPPAAIAASFAPLSTSFRTGAMRFSLGFSWSCAGADWARS